MVESTNSPIRTEGCGLQTETRVPGLSTLTAPPPIRVFPPAKRVPPVSQASSPRLTPSTSKPHVHLNPAPPPAIKFFVGNVKINPKHGRSHTDSIAEGFDKSSRRTLCFIQPEI